ncbi:hypothetical protein AWC38_SpisGene6722 [Stylophora pistillata]|uniref:Uncharacterized protein n=1 Tax=Stylophora pistillata TaxID=50429 RepID=A0A2B4SJ66_STYPI|nr:hypothetical protein AWC38_SpisGene6722 [Stylophora pistillata]
MGRGHDRGKKTMSIHHQAAKYGQELNLPEAEVIENEPTTNYVRGVKLKAKHQALEQLKSKWEEKPLHGQCPKRTKEKNVDQDQTHNWLSSPGLKSEREGFISAAQDQCIKTNYYRNKILKDGTDPMCRICGQFQETIDRLVSGCPELAETEYIRRRNKAAAYLHWTICKHYNIKANGRIRWSVRMNNDLLECKKKALDMVKSDNPPRLNNGRKMGYMQVMKEMWEEKGYGDFALTSQNLRDQATRLEKTFGSVADSLSAGIGGSERRKEGEIVSEELCEDINGLQNANSCAV